MDFPQLNDLTVKDIGEQGLLQRVQRYCPPDIIGDDGAVLALASRQPLVVTTDVLVDGVHFCDRTTSPEDVGWRAAAANLSDLAAMGASPIGITVGLSLPSSTLLSWVEGLYSGLTDCLRPYATPIVGGDICRSSIVSLAITAFGQISDDFVIRRNLAQVGDAIVVTGVHGASRAGLELLLRPEAECNLTDSDKTALILAHQRPIPRLDVLVALKSLVKSMPNGLRVAGMDSSDGLADAVLQVCRASGVGAIIEASSIPMPRAFAALNNPEQAMNWTLYGGEDFELVLCLPLTAAAELVKRLGGQAAIIGEIQAGKRVELCDRKGQYLPQTLTLASGFQHFVH